MGCSSPGVWATEGSLTFVLIGGISGSRGRLLIKWSAGYLSIQMNGCYYFLYGHNLLCGHSVWDIISLIASSVQHHGSAENSPEAAGVTFEKCSPLQFLSIGLSQHWILQDFYSLLDPQPHTYNGSRVLVKLWIVSFLWIAYITKSLLSFYHLSVWAPLVWRVFSLEGSSGSSSI